MASESDDTVGARKLRRDVWDRLDILSKLVAATIIPLAIAFVGHWYTDAIKQRELEGRFSELVLALLAKQPGTDGAGDEQVRRWAAAVVAKYSGVAMDEATITSLAQSTRLPQLVAKTMASGSWRLQRSIGCTDQ
jgi:hypothetical protein